MVQVQEKFYGREVILADRDMVEQNSGDYQKFNICNFSFIARWYNFYFLQMKSYLELISAMWHFWLLVILLGILSKLSLNQQRLEF